jgi:isopenicillin N synthase-like dioxygenase
MHEAKLKSSATTIACLPPFPSNIRTAPLYIVSLAKLLSDDANECKRALEACRTRGFFYLDLTDTNEGHELEQESEELLDVAKGVFNLPLEEKMKYPQVMGGSLAGWA